MAAYAATVTVDRARVERISRNLGILTGIVDVTNYNTTLAEITDITKYFDTVLAVVCEASDNGFIYAWDRTNKALLAYYGDYSEASDGAFIQVVNDVDCGAAHFVAIGRI